VEIFRRQLDKYAVEVQTGCVVESVRWNDDNAELRFRNRQSTSTLSASHVLVTIPLSLLTAHDSQPGTIEFSPPLPPEKMDALGKLEMGQVIRVVLRFQNRFWEDISAPNGSDGKTLANMSFLFSDDEFFPTWWTTMPVKSPLITGWAPFRSAEKLSHQATSFVVQRSVQTLGELLGVPAHHLQHRLAGAYFHDWQADPFSRGAYSYGKVGCSGAQAVLAAPLGDTLFFAGEATDTSGSNGTVHGAIASGYRAAEQILRQR
jgi:monoamine oxidase